MSHVVHGFAPLSMLCMLSAIQQQMRLKALSSRSLCTHFFMLAAEKQHLLQLQTL